MFLRTLTVSTYRLIHSSRFPTCFLSILLTRTNFCGVTAFSTRESCFGATEKWKAIAATSCFQSSQADSTLARVSEVFRFIVLSIVFIIWQKVGSTSKVPTFHQPRRPPNPSVRAYHQHQPTRFQDKDNWCSCSWTSRTKDVSSAILTTSNSLLTRRVPQKPTRHDAWNFDVTIRCFLNSVFLQYQRIQKSTRDCLALVYTPPIDGFPYSFFFPNS